MKNYNLDRIKHVLNQLKLGQVASSILINNPCSYTPRQVKHTVDELIKIGHIRVAGQALQAHKQTSRVLEITTEGLRFIQAQTTVELLKASKKSNKSKLKTQLLLALDDGRQASRLELQVLLGTYKSRVNNTLRKLVAEGLVVESNATCRERSRRLVSITNAGVRYLR